MSFFLESIVGYITGWALILWGMALWLPYVFSVTGRLEKKSKSLALYESIAKFSAYGDASPATFGKIANEAIETFGYQAATFHIMNTANQLELFGAIGLTDKSKNLIKRVNDGLLIKVHKSGEIYMADDEVRIHPGKAIETTSGSVVDALCMPVDFGTKRVGVLTFYTDHPRTFSSEELKVLETVSANLGLAFYKDGLFRSLNNHKALRDFIAVTLKTSRSEDNFNTQIIRLAKLLKGFMNFESAHYFLTSNGPSQLLDFNLPVGSKVIVERGHFDDVKYMPVRWVIANQRGLNLPEHRSLLGFEYNGDDSASVLYTPILVSGQAIGVLGITMKGQHQFGHSEIIACEAVATVLSGVVLNEQNIALSSEAFDRIGAIKYSLETIWGKELLGNELKELARVIVEKTPATFCRIMLLDQERATFQTVAIYQRRELLWDETTLAKLPLAELYSHRKVIATGHPEILGASDKATKMSELESRLLLPEGINQCMIIPIVIEGKTIGLATIGENRRPERRKLDSGELMFASLLTTLISMYLWQKNSRKMIMALADSNRLAGRKVEYYENRTKSLSVVWSLPSRMNGPLAGIMASCEFIKHSKEMRREELEKYLDMISKNAEKIHHLSGQFAEARKVIDKVADKAAVNQ